MRTGVLEPGARGIDCNQPLTPATLAVIRAYNNSRPQRSARYQFVTRYVRREQKHDYDISCSELGLIHQAGLGVMLVQHVASKWHPTKDMGATYGATAASHAIGVLYPTDAVVWCDLEDVAPKVPAADVIDYCNAWYDAVKGAGFEPGLYVGDSCGLDAKQLYYNLRFKLYWSAYNLNLDNYPLVRGVAVRQMAYPKPALRMPNFSYEYDEDLIIGDALGNMPVLALP